MGKTRLPQDCSPEEYLTLGLIKSEGKRYLNKNYKIFLVKNLNLQLIK